MAGPPPRAGHDEHGRTGRARSCRRQRRTLLASAAGAALIVGIALPFWLLEGRAEPNREQAKTLVQSARQRLLEVDVIAHAWIDGMLRSSATRSGTLAIQPTLEEALQDYDRALALGPGRGDVACERDIVAFVSTLESGNTVPARASVVPGLTVAFTFGDHPR